MVLKLEITGHEKLHHVATVEQMQQAFTDSFYNRGLFTVQKLQKMFSDVLEPGADEDVGASGKAARNVIQAWEGQGQSGTWYIKEGSATRANRIIREGLPPGSKVPIEKLRRWAADKGIKLYYDTSYWDENGMFNRQRSPNAVLDRLTSTKGISFTRSRWFGGVGVKPQSSMKPSQVAEKGLYALRYALYKRGTNRSTAHWTKLYPTGAGRFMYGRYVRNKRSGDIKDVMKHLGLEVSEDMADALFNKGE